MTSFDAPLAPPPDDPRERRAPTLSSRFVAIGVMLTLVLVSAVAGAAIDRLALRRPPGEFGEHGPGGPGGRGGGPGRGGGGGGPFEDRLTGDLALTPAQRLAIDSALAIQFRDFEAARASVQPRIDSILTTTRARIDAILTPAQRAAMPAFPDDRGPGFGRGGDGRGPGGPGFGPPRDHRDGGPPRGGRGRPRESSPRTPE